MRSRTISPHGNFNTCLLVVDWRLFTWCFLLSQLINYWSTFLLGADIILRDGRSTLFCFDWWLDGKTPRDVWPNLFSKWWSPSVIVFEFHLLAPSTLHTNLREVHVLLYNCLAEGRDSRIWRWDKNDSSSIKFFYNFFEQWWLEMSS